ncbi:MAG: hypothetical protein GF309_11895 [Candidatus Lokiarchaeota archaeon]|nr:hypothetical protein [Candidatus Lokiarchaeota archaeon]
MDTLGIVVLIVFAVTYLVIATEKVNRTGMSLFGLAIIGVVFWLSSLGQPDPQLSFENLVGGIPWTTILFVASMMIVVAVAGGSGMFQYIALRLAQLGGGDYKSLFRTFLLFVWILSLILPKTTIMIIMVPLTIQVCKVLDINFKPFLMSEALVCNIGSTPSVVGGVVNIIITEETNLNAGLLFFSMMPLSALLLIVTWFVVLYYFEEEFGDTDKASMELVKRLKPATMIKSKRDFYASIIAFAVLITGFVLGSTTGIQPAMIALLVAAALLVMAHERASEFLSEIGWSTVFFLVGVFGLVEALGVVGFIQELGVWLQAAVGNNSFLAVLFMVWFPSSLSAVLNNLPVSAVLAPVALDLVVLTPVIPLALILAVNVGGNLFTPLGSPANMVVLDHSERERNPVTLAEFAKIGTIVGLIHLAIGSVWLLVLSMLLI